MKTQKVSAVNLDSNRVINCHKIIWAVGLCLGLLKEDHNFKHNTTVTLFIFFYVSKRSLNIVIPESCYVTTYDQVFYLQNIPLTKLCTCSLYQALYKTDCLHTAVIGCLVGTGWHSSQKTGGKTACERSLLLLIWTLAMSCWESINYSLYLGTIDN